jgi:CCR4-NOT transcription complex subunit 2
MSDFTSTQQQQQQQQLDMSEFPALGSGSTRMMEFSASGAGSNGNNQQHPSPLYQQRAWNSSGGPSGTTFSAVIGGLSNSGGSGVAVNDFGRPPMQEDFPALGTLPNQQQRISQQQQHRIGSLRGHSSSANVSAPGASSNAGAGSDVSQNLSAMGTLQGNFVSAQGNLPSGDQQGPPGTLTSPGSYSTAGAKMSPNGNAPATQNAANLDRFGLMGLLGVIRMTDQDLNTLALGCDLTTLGLNLSSTE